MLENARGNQEEDFVLEVSFVVFRNSILKTSKVKPHAIVFPVPITAQYYSATPFQKRQSWDTPLQMATTRRIAFDAIRNVFHVGLCERLYFA